MYDQRHLSKPFYDAVMTIVGSYWHYRMLSAHANMLPSFPRGWNGSYLVADSQTVLNLCERAYVGDLNIKLI